MASFTSIFSRIAKHITQRELHSKATCFRGAQVLSTPEKRSGGCVVPLSYYKLDPKKASGRAQSDKLPPVVVLHGVLASGNTYRSVLKRDDFAPEREIYAVDLRNHGSSPHVQEMSYEAMIRDVKCFLEDNGITKACILGHSMGGKVGMLMALEYPELVSELVVVDCAPVTYEKQTNDKSSSTEAVFAMSRIRPHQCKTRGEIDKALEQEGILSERVRQFVMTNLVPDDEKPGYYKWRVNLPALTDSMDAMLGFPQVSSNDKVYHGPTLFVKGENSHYITDQYKPVIQSYFPKAIIRSIAQTGHWLIAEDPDSFTRLVNEFLGSADHSSSQ
eukprot:jgi/Galph1/5028/GphlegSOOS_G3659.1